MFYLHTAERKSCYPSKPVRNKKVITRTHCHFGIILRVQRLKCENSCTDGKNATQFTVLALITHYKSTLFFKSFTFVIKLKSSYTQDSYNLLFLYFLQKQKQDRNTEFYCKTSKGKQARVLQDKGP